jgi:polar amino acid transport system substrate-binding protein
MTRTCLLALLCAAISFCTGCSKEEKSGGAAAAAGKPLIIGTDATYPPFETVDEKNELTGVDIDLGRALGEYLGRPVEFRNINFDGLIVALKAGSVDLIISSMSATEDRRTSLDFSDPYVKTGICILVSSKSTVQSVDDLKAPGRKLVVRLGTTGETYSRQNYPNAAITALDADSACAQEVANGNVDAWIYDQISLMRYHERYKDTTRVLLKPLREEVWAIAMRKGDDALRNKINEFLKKFRAEGGFTKLADKHLKAEREMLKAQGIPFVFDL